MTTAYHTQYWAHLLTLKGGGDGIAALSRSISNARLDLNPHQVDAALFALRSPLSRGVLLADEVGLGKTIEAGIILAQRWAERRRKVLLILPAFLRQQWRQELEEKFFLPTRVLEGAARGRRKKNAPPPPDPLEQLRQLDRLALCSYEYAAKNAQLLAQIPWDLVVIDEAHRLRNVYKKDNKVAARISAALGQVNKLLLTATPLQNSLMELYGLVSTIDPHVFGDERSFREQFLRAASAEELRARDERLRERLRPVCQRTLRKQVVEYVRFTARVPLTQDFLPSDPEQELYERVSAYLQRPQLIALPNSQRALITLVLRKLLASSTFAIAATLRELVRRLEALARLQGHPARSAAEGANEAPDDATGEAAGEAAAGAEAGEEAPEEDFSAFDEAAEEWDDDPAAGAAAATVDPRLLKEELAELRSFAALAEGISANAKGQALLAALSAAFARTEAIGAARKAVVFTESRRTQKYLFDLLTANGYPGKVVLISGTNDDPASKAAYQGWLRRHAGRETITGNPSVDLKAALVEEFRERAVVCVATEAAAEGVNLQFCSLVVNYDLPWNPQRIEQRIGRCHRYGQKHDVVVVNFINRRNAADVRVFQLLSEKFNLFSGVFGASDEVLGAIESGVDIEKRIARVYQEARTAGQIQAAFDQLQRDLDEQIRATLASTRQTLLEHFDREVRERLKVSRDETASRLSEREHWLLALTRAELGGRARFDPDRPRFFYDGDGPATSPRGWYNLDWKEAENSGESFYRQDHPLAVRLIEAASARELSPLTIEIDYTGGGTVLSVVKPLVGSSGWLELSKLTIESARTEEFLLLAAVADDGQLLDEDVCRKLLSLPARVLDHPESAGVADPPAEAALQAAGAALVSVHVKEMDARNGRFLEEEVEKLERWSADLKLSLEAEVKELDKQIAEARKASRAGSSLAEKLAGQKQIKELEDKRKAKRKELFDAQDQVDDRRDGLIADIERQLEQRHQVRRVFRFRWNVL